MQFPTVFRRLVVAVFCLAPAAVAGLCQTADAAFTPFGAGGIPLRLRTAFSVDGGGTPVVISLLNIDANAMSFTNGRGGLHAARLEAFVSVFDESGTRAGESAQSGNIALATPEWQAALRDGVAATFVTRLDQRPGAYHVEVTIRDTNSDRLGCATGVVETPDLKKGKLALSSIVIDEKNARGGINPLRRTFHPGEVLPFSYLILNAHRDAEGKPQVRSQVLLLRDGAEVFKSENVAPNVKPHGTSAAFITSAEVKLGGKLSEGNYVLQVVVTDQGAANVTATQRTEFQVR